MKAAARVQPAVADLVAPLRVQAVELGQRLEPPGGPETTLQVAHCRLDRALLPRRPWRARMRMKAIVTTQMRERGFQTIRSPSRRATTERRLSYTHSRGTPPNTPTHAHAPPRTTRPSSPTKRTPSAHPNTAGSQQAHTRAAPAPTTTAATASPPNPPATPAPAVPRALRRPHIHRPQPLQMRLHQPHRPRVAVLGTQKLRHPRRLDLRPLLNQLPQHPLQRIQHRPRRRPPIHRRLHTASQPSNRPSIHPQPPRNLPLRHPSAHTPAPSPNPTRSATPSASSLNTRSSTPPSTGQRTRSTAQRVAHYSTTDPGAVSSCARQQAL